MVVFAILMKYGCHVHPNIINELIICVVEVCNGSIVGVVDMP